MTSARRSWGGIRANAVSTALRYVLLSVSGPLPAQPSHPAPPAGGEIPGDPAHPGQRVVVRGQSLPPGQGAGERLLGQILGLAEVAQVGVHGNHQTSVVRGVERLVAFVALPSRRRLVAAAGGHTSPPTS